MSLTINPLVIKTPQWIKTLLAQLGLYILKQTQDKMHQGVPTFTKVLKESEGHHKLSRDLLFSETGGTCIHTTLISFADLGVGFLSSNITELIAISALEMTLSVK